jgi:hypothetical protein
VQKRSQLVEAVEISAWSKWGATNLGKPSGCGASRQPTNKQITNLMHFTLLKAEFSQQSEPMIAYYKLPVADLISTPLDLSRYGSVLIRETSCRLLYLDQIKKLLTREDPEVRFFLG